MNGMSDVRLALHRQERVTGQERAMTAPTHSRWCLFWRHRHTRKALLTLSPEQLRDIGLTAEQARQEGLKPFWRS
ncbi:hypothetical protein BFW88_27165 [Pseudomonas fluorescens]|uniref:DUF1127 domain-containing protein n=1 Tax=Pseudomonas lactucae TaxID=2813360 RepID=A0A9X0YGK2_9PSED|nr:MULTISPECIES: DUF1127 domain-containing protein [Pseudomonas]EFQ60485.1 hypothetical protein PFWH6_5759 [Pseudomonas fluorescens WH6]OPA82891.1 hypothetical protein BFW86_28150 [Pseudomonas fluorescens]MBN2979528.1 DUF1127 domain-containing protein [Pseudomonas lactucae]MBN2988774.1 DUF1127 domain-containing protein [Pseudomonas lactucae]OPA83488.1 hypothetical protein BFW88_27165 [Pseudomonas fluorescens]